MGNNLELITTEKFGEVACDFYRNLGDDIFVTRKQIGEALEYTNPDDALSRIHKRHADRLDEFSLIVKLSSTDGKKYDTTLYTERGVMEICRWSRQSKANQFMDWCFDIVQKYRNGQLQSLNSFNTAINNLQEEIKHLSDKVEDLQSNTPEWGCRLHNHLDQQLPTKKRIFSRWTSRMFPKYNLLMDHLGIYRKELFHNLYIELQNRYPDIDLQQLQEDYCFENGLENCYTMDVIEHNKQIRELFEHMVNSLLEKYHLSSPEDNSRGHTIFDN